MSASCFYLRPEKDDNKVLLEDKDLEVLGAPSIQYDDTNVILQHIESGLWFSYKVPSEYSNKSENQFFSGQFITLAYMP